MFQMTPLVLQAHLQTAREIVHDMNTFLYGIALILTVIAVLKSPIVWGLFSYTWSFR